MSGAHMVCMYGKILTSILRSDVYMTSRPACDWVYISLVPSLFIGVHSCRWLGWRRSSEKVPLRVESERPLDEGTEWVVGCSTETGESSPSTESMLFLGLNQ